MSMKIFMVWHASARMVLFQWCLEMRKSGGKMMGRMTWRPSVMRLMMYSLFHTFSARSHTWKCSEPMHLAMRRNSGSCTSANCSGSIRYRISSSSLKKSTSLALFDTGQYLSRCASTSSMSAGSFSRYCATQYESCGWKSVMKRALCSGSSARHRNTWCSCLSGIEKPLMIEPSISSSSAMPLCTLSSCTTVQKMSITDLRMNARRLRNLP
mmetsp:Transcript_28377/g.68998  ORF Transcript_28377/g.68998 Transcript_28377/m.68998 type:complete len:211 (+) Transcript_28377:205-837(+)